MPSGRAHFWREMGERSQSAYAGRIGAVGSTPREAYNLRVLTLYQVILRIGWIFKTESVIMPAFLDAVAGAGWLRGLLPVLGRVGLSVPPLFYAARLRAMPRKKWVLAWWGIAMGLPFLVQAWAWHARERLPAAAIAPLFLLMYATFSICNGLNGVSLNTLIGKLVQPQRRGRLMADASVSGSILAVGCAWWLLGDWLVRSDHGFHLVFGFTGVLFVLTAGAAVALREHADKPPPLPISTAEAETFYMKNAWVAALRRGTRAAWQAAWQTLRDDPRFRRLVAVTTFASVGSILFPHYQALARERLHLGQSQMMVWVVVQNGAIGLFGLLLGPLADRRGNRLTLRVALAATMFAPALAFVMTRTDPAWAHRWFWLVFVPLGFTPLSLKTFVNYTLELAPRAEHPRYLSALGVCQALPFLAAPGLGWLADATSFEFVFALGAICIAISVALTFRIPEPRWQSAQDQPASRGKLAPLAWQEEEG